MLEPRTVKVVRPDDLFGPMPAPDSARAKEDLETRGPWEKLRQIVQPSEMDRRTVIRLVNPLIAVGDVPRREIRRRPTEREALSSGSRIAFNASLASSGGYSSHSSIAVRGKPGGCG